MRPKSHFFFLQRQKYFVKPGEADRVNRREARAWFWVLVYDVWFQPITREGEEGAAEKQAGDASVAPSLCRSLIFASI